MGAAALAAFWLLFFWALLVRRSHFIPFDLIDQHYMFQAFIHRRMDDVGSLWWTPNIVGGYPIGADPLSAIFYPPNFLMHVLIPREFLPYLAMELQATLHFLWAALGMYLLAYLLTGSRFGGLVAGLAWAFGSYFAWHLPHLSPISTVSWLPWILFAYYKAITQRSLFWTGLAALATGVMMLAGHAITILQTAYLLIGLGIVSAWLLRGRGRRVAGTALLQTAGIVVLGAALAAIQLLPSWHLSAQTHRADFGFEQAADSSFAPYWSITALIPNFFSVSGPGEYWAAGDPAETNLYMGIVTLVLAATGVVFARAADRRATMLLVGATALSLLLAFGVFAWPFQIVYDLLPGFDRVRRPVTFIAFAQLAIALLAAFGIKALACSESSLSTWSRLARWLGIATLAVFGLAMFAGFIMVTTIGEPTQQQIIAIVSGLVLAGVVLLAAFAVTQAGLRSVVSVHLALGLLVILVAVDLGSAHESATYRHDQMSPSAYIGQDWVNNPEDPLIPQLQQELGERTEDPFRVLPEGTASVWANGTLVWGLDSASGYVVLCPTQYCDLLQHARSNLTSPLFDLLNIRYLVTDRVLEEEDPQTANEFELIYDQGPRVYENPDVLPRARVVHQVVRHPEEQVLGAMTSEPGLITELVVISDPEAPDIGSVPSEPGTAEIVSYENTRISIDASMPDDGYLVLADTYYPGWSATVSGEETQVYRANHAFRAVYLPEGDHRVEFTYQQPWLREGAVVSGVAVLVALGLVVFGVIRAFGSGGVYPRRGSG